MDLKKELKIINSTGKIVVGFRKSLITTLQKKSRAIVVANNCPPELRREIEIASRVTKTHLINSGLTAKEISSAIGKPFGSSVLAITDPGTSTILEARGGE